MADLTLSSESFNDGDYLGQAHVLSESYGFGCAGGNQSPQLSWDNVPEGAESFAVTCYDPDAPTGSGFWHWVRVNIPKDARSLDLDTGNPDVSKTPSGALEVRTDFSVPGYGGPCSPKGSHPHRYIFTVHAVGTEALPVTADSSAAVVGFMLNFNTVAKATLMGLFKR